MGFLYQIDNSIIVDTFKELEERGTWNIISVILQIGTFIRSCANISRSLQCWNNSKSFIMYPKTKLYPWFYYAIKSHNFALWQYCKY